MTADTEDLVVDLDTGAISGGLNAEVSLQQAFLWQIDIATSRLKRTEWLDLTGEKAFLSMSKRFRAAIALHGSCPQQALFFFSSYMRSCGFYVRALFTFREKQVQHIESMMMRVDLTDHHEGPRRPDVEAALRSKPCSRRS